MTSASYGDKVAAWGYRLGPNWRWKPAGGQAAPWCSLVPLDRAMPSQGWKIHVSAYLWSAHAILAQVLPVAAAHRVPIKVLAHRSYLLAINDGDAGRAQVGKFITLYPADDATVAALTAELIAVTRGMPGPPISTDRALDPEAPVHLRYGVFDTTMMQTELGTIYSAITDPAGVPVPDRRDPYYVQPDWVTFPRGARPFEPVSAVAPDIELVAELYRSARSEVDLALLLEPPVACVVKRYLAGPEHSCDGATLRMRREADMLAALAGCDGATPLPIRCIAGKVNRPDAFLVMTDLPGTSLDKFCNQTYGRGIPLQPERVVRIARRLARVLERIHAAGIVHGDLKSANVLLDAGDEVRVVDFDQAVLLGSTARTAGYTRGYVAGTARRRPSTADDIYAFGAVLFLLATGAEASRAPDPEHLLSRSIERLNPLVPAAVTTAITACLDPDPARRPTAAALAHGHVETRAPMLDVARARHPLDVAFGLGETLCAVAHPVPGEPGRAWTSRHAIGKGRVLRDVNTGVGGTLLALAEIVQVLDVPVHREQLAAGAEWLLASKPFLGGPLPGLYVGESGVALALLRCGQVLGEPLLIDAALGRLRAIDPAGILSPDLFHGLAGHVRARLIGWKQSGDAADKAVALECARILVSRRIQQGQHCWWTLPPAFGKLARSPCLGYAHGAAGIIDVLLDVYETSGEADLIPVIEDGLRWIASHEVVTSEGANGWPISPGEPIHAPFWCHGAGGIGSVFRRAARSGLCDHADDIAARARASVAALGRWAGASLCHGLGGMIDAILDHDPLDQSEELADLTELLHGFAVNTGEGLAWITEAPRIVTPDNMVGYAGLALLMLRLADRSRPRPLSLASFPDNGRSELGRPRESVRA